MRSTEDPIARLAAADPLESEQLGSVEQAEADALLARLMGEPVELRSQRRPVRRLALAVAAAGVALVFALVGVDLLDDDAPGPNVVERAVAAVTATDAVFHTVELSSWSGSDLDRSSGPRGAYIEAWYGSDGSVHQKLYANRDGRRGRLLGETAGRLRPRGGGRYGGVMEVYEPRTDTLRQVRFGRVRQRQPRELDPNRDPGRAMRELQRLGRLRVEGRTRVDGRDAYRLVSGPVRGFAPGLTESYVYLVDADTYYPLRLTYRFGEGKHWAETEVRYLVYERRPLDAAGRAALEMDPHPGAKLERLPRR
jgi:hypothetical protein